MAVFIPDTKCCCLRGGFTTGYRTRKLRRADHTLVCFVINLVPIFNTILSGTVFRTRLGGVTHFCRFWVEEACVVTGFVT